MLVNGLSVRLSVNSRLLVIKFWGSQKLYANFWCSQPTSPPPPPPAIVQGTAGLCMCAGWGSGIALLQG